MLAHVMSNVHRLRREDDQIGWIVIVLVPVFVVDYFLI